MKTSSSADVKRKNALVKRVLLGIALTLAASIFAAGCQESSSGGGSSDSHGLGPLQQISGVVLDDVTALPLQGVTVEAAGKKATTDASGYYLLDDVIPNPDGNSYTIYYYKSGYLPAEYAGVYVDAQEYLNKDPFFEKGVIDNLTTLFQTWMQNLHPDIAANSTLTTWTYTNGVYVNSDGTTVQVTDAGDGTPKFELKGLDYTYKFGRSVATRSLKPLTASLKGKIFLYTGGNITDAAALTQANIVVQFKDGSGKIYGTGKTDANGGFAVTGLPANTTGLSLVMPGFVEGDAYYDGTSVTAYNGTNFASASFFTLKDSSDVWNVYLKGKTDAAYIANVAAGGPGAPIAPSSKITVTFSKAIDAKTFTASIAAFGNTKGTATDDDNFAFDAEWNQENTVATLTPRKKLSSYTTTGMLPYSIDKSVRIGQLLIYAKAADGSSILDPEKPTTAVGPAAARAAKFDVYTQEGIKLLSAEVVVAPPARAVLPVGGALKLTFNKNVAPLVGDTAFSIGNVPAAYKVDAADAKIVYVYADKPIASDSSLTYKVFAADDAFNDTTTQDAVSVAGISGDGLYKDGIVVNPYLGKASPTAQDKENVKKVFTNVLIGAANPGWKRADAIKLEFSASISGGNPTVTVYYQNGSSYINAGNATVSLSNNKELTITLPTGLAGGRTFYLSFTVTIGGETYIIGPKALNADATEVQVTLVADTSADLDRAGTSIASITTGKSSIEGVIGTAAVLGASEIFILNSATENNGTREFIGYIKSSVDPVWKPLEGANFTLSPAYGNGTKVNTPGFNIGSIPAYNSSGIKVKWRGVSSKGTVIETPEISVTFAAPSP
ncbi:MAG: carboxypeptidase-like regulatory domain-containing protein [Treponema sp.]|nr:carboxypeptidase-like regulatory domain-containing protein [Treponema sp.]